MTRFSALALLLFAQVAQANSFDWAGKVEADAADIESDDLKKRQDAVNALSGDEINLAAPYLMKVVQKTNEDENLRQQAARALGAGQAEVAIPVMKDWLSGFNKKDAAVAAEVLGDIGGADATNALTRSLGDSDPGVRVNAVKALGKIGLRGNPNVVIALIPRLEDDKPDVKRETIDQLEALGDRRAVIPLVARFGDSQLEIRKSAVRAVGHLGDPSAVPALIRLLNDSQEEIRSAAAGSLGQLNAVDAIDALTEQLNTGSDLFREKVAIALAQIAAAPGAAGRGGEDAMRILVANLASPQQRTRTANALKLAGRAAVPALVAHLEGKLAGDPTTAVSLLAEAADSRATAALAAELERGRVATPLVLKALGATHDPAALVPLLGALSNKEAAIRLAAMDALEPLLGDDARAGDVLIEHLTDDDLEIRILAAEYLGRLQDAAAASKLISLSGPGNPSRLRLAAIDALGLIGAGDHLGAHRVEAGKALVAVLKEGPTELHRAAATALSYLTDPDSIAALITLARSDRGPTRDEFVRALGATLRGHDDKTARRVLRELADDSNGRVAVAALCGLAAAGNPDDFKFLRQMTEQGASDRRRTAAWALGEVHDTGGIDVLMTVMQSKDDRLAGDASWALGEILTASSQDNRLGTITERWLHEAHHGGWAAAIDGAAALARVLWVLPAASRAQLLSGQRRADLQSLAFHKSRLVRMNAAIALGTLADDDAIKVLAQLAHDDASPHVRATAIEALVRLQSKDDRVIAALKSAELDGDLGVRAAVKSPATAPVTRTDWTSFYVVDPSADDAAVRQEPYFVVGPDGFVWATYSDPRGHITSEHVPHGDATVWPASRESEY